MPELPEVETQCRDLRAAGLVGRIVTDAMVLWERSLGGMAAETFRRQVRGRVVKEIYRRGKYLGMVLDDGRQLLIHLRMSGSLSVREHDAPRDPHDRIILRLSEGELVFHDPRKFGRIVLTEDPEAVLGRLGPEPLDPQLSPDRFHALITSRRKALKPLLLEQSIVAGIGNIYADEGLFGAGLHPLRQSDRLTREETGRLLESLRHVLRQGIENRGTSLGGGEGNFASDGRYGNNAGRLLVFRRTGASCPRCGGIIERIVVGQRTTHICPVCQPLPDNGR